VPLLTRISGLNAGLASNIVSYRDAHGAFRSATTLKKVPRLGDKTFEQAAGFLRVPNGDNPLDASSVHPEAYPVVEKIIVDLKKPIKEILGDSRCPERPEPSKYTDERFGLPTVQDIFKELEKPGRDPRPEFKTATFADGVEKVSDLRPGMILEGVVTNVAAFGAFVDIGVHQDGLVHVSALSNTFVKDPHDVVKAGQVVKVKVLEVDLQRQRIALTMRMATNQPKASAPPSSNPYRSTQLNSHRSDLMEISVDFAVDRSNLVPPLLSSCLFYGKTTMEAWAMEEFAGAALGDERLNQRLVKLATRFADKPTASIPGACGDWSETQAAYRFFE
jgi:uncharacterized protein